LIGNNVAINNAGDRTHASFDLCVATNKAKLGEYGPYDKVWTPCWNQFSTQFEKNAEGHWFVALAFAVIPIPIAWLIGWILIATTRWIAGGFTRRPHDAQ
jgi:hypothetical protein